MVEDDDEKKLPRGMNNTSTIALVVTWRTNLDAGHPTSYVDCRKDAADLFTEPLFS